MRFAPLPSRLLALAALCGSAFSTPAAVGVQWVSDPGGVGVAATPQGEAYTAAWEYAPAGDIVVSKRSASGQLLWERRFDNTDNTRHEAATSVATDALGHVWVSGTIRSGYSSPVNAASVLMKFSPDGQLLWRQVFDNSFDGSSTRRVLVDAAGNSYVLGLGMGPLGLVSRVKSFDANGLVRWDYFDTAGIGAPLHMKWGQDGSLLVSGRSVTGSRNGYLKLSSAGQLVWASAGHVSLTAGDVAATANGESYLINGQPDGSAGSQLRKLDATGATLWTASHPMAAFRVEADRTGQAVFSGFPNSGTAGAAFAKFNAQGQMLWQNLDADGPSNSLLLHAQMLLDADDNAYLAASTLFQMALTQVRADGSTGWTVTAPGSNSSGMAFTPDGGVLLAGGQTAKIGDPATANASVALSATPSRCAWAKR
ncbi:hypothetical protein [Ideonella paludis]|uniref:hypothetical protein n=1 Tax=Ideonella paludis TaxID=1233411 RepID=UPI00363501CE